MTGRSRIEWTETTWNPTTGLRPDLRRLRLLLALTMAGRLKVMGSAKY